MAHPIHEANARKAQLEARLAGFKAEFFKMPPQAQMTAAQKARYLEIEAKVEAGQGELITITAELAELLKDKAEDKAEAEARTPVLADRSARGRKFAQMFPGVAMDLGGFKSAEEFLATLHSGLSDARLQPAYTPRGLQATSTTTVGSEGGFSVPTQVFARWLDLSLESEIVRSRAYIQPMDSNEGKAPGWDDGDRSSTLYGGFTGEWLGETGELTPQTAKLRLVKLKAKKLAILARVSNELIADGLSFEAQLGLAISKALGYFLDTAFLSGVGANQPLGIIGAACTVSVTKETGQGAASIIYDNIAKMFARMLPASLSSAVWVCNSTAIPQLLNLGQAVGVGGSVVPVLNESNGQFKMLTRPVIFTDKLPAVGTVGDILFADFSQYIVGLRADFSLAKSQHIGFTSDTTYYRGIIRVDGQPALSAPVTPAHGATQSPFVVLATRA